MVMLEKVDLQLMLQSSEIEPGPSSIVWFLAARWLSQHTKVPLRLCWHISISEEPIIRILHNCAC
jgi:hypothetical protein